MPERFVGSALISRKKCNDEACDVARRSRFAARPAGPAGVERDRILLTEFQSTDWNSLTFSGERHVIDLRIPGPDANGVSDRLLGGLDEAEFAIPGQIVADIALIGSPARGLNGSLCIKIEALTVAE